ncbi:methyltransferase domain-containing protein [Pleurocapsales cyanobacterium LEGE 06147]|nr:methyltransferase domain-containing protein [Pleurocapsales cyanobacterium LEGE 06147]
MLIKQKAKTLLNTFPPARVAKCIVDDSIQGLRLSLGQIDTNCGSTHSTRSTAESVAYIEEVFTDYKKYGNIEKFFGVAAEIGPGDNAGVALLMRQDGCTQVDLIDRYFSARNSQQQSKIYEALARRYELDRLHTKDYWDEQALANISWKIGQAAEKYFERCARERGQVYDFIVSRAVLEHLYDPLETLHQMVACLKPGGRMLHKIDFRDHGMFTPTHHELLFLQIPDFIYPLMVRNSGRPNRILVHRYRDVLESIKKSGLIDYSILITNLVNVGEILPHQVFTDIDIDKRRKAINFVEKHRRKLAGEFLHVDSQDLAIAGIFLIVTKKS